MDHYPAGAVFTAMVLTIATVTVAQQDPHEPLPQSRTFPGSIGVSDLTFNGQANAIANRLRVTPAKRMLVGSVWLTHPVDINHGFTTEFRFSMTAPGVAPGIRPYGIGADGFAFVIQGVGPTAIGGVGGGLGYDIIARSLAVEFDTWCNDHPQDVGGEHNGDPAMNHISIHSRGIATNSADEHLASLVKASVPNRLNDGAEHTVKIQYRSGVLDVYLDNMSSPILTTKRDLSSFLGLTDGQAWIGFTAATGEGWENHDIHYWNVITDTPSLSGDECLCVDVAINESQVLGMNDGLVLHYSFESSAVDHSVNHNDGAPHGNVSYVPGVLGNAVYLDGRSYILSPPIAWVSRAFTIAGWIRPTSGVADWIPFVTKGGDSEINAFGNTFNLEFHQGSGNVRLQYDNTWREVQTSQPMVTQGIWSFVAVTYEKGVIRYYLNGNLHDVRMKQLSLRAAPSPIYVGRDIPGADEWLRGSLDEIRVYNRVLSAEDIRRLYGASRSISVQPEDSFDWLNCFVDRMRNRLLTQSMVEPYMVGAERIYTPKFFAPEMDWRLLLNRGTEQYSANLWLCTMYMLAQERAPSRACLKPLSGTETDSELLTLLLQIVDAGAAAFEAKGAAQIEAIEGIRHTFGRTLVELGVRRGFFKSIKTTDAAAFNRLGYFVGGLSLMLAGVDTYTKYQKMHALAEALASWGTLEDEILPMLESHSLATVDNNLRMALTQYRSTGFAFEQAQRDVLLGRLAVEAACFVIAIKALPALAASGFAIGGPVGSVLATLAGVAILAIAPGAWADGMEFMLYRNISSRLLTLAVGSSGYNKQEVITNATALMLSARLIHDYVIGKGIFSGAGQVLGGEESRWARMYEECIHPIEREALSKIESANR